MTERERWRKAEAIFHDVLARDRGERAGYLADACGPDTRLRRDVERLLASDDDSDKFMAAPLSAGFSVPSPEALIKRGWPGAGERLGPYRLLERLGGGGMGTVWLAERADEQFRKRAAIKLIKRGMDTDEILRRFQNERQVLAELEHPYIARLIDGGATDDGRPYLVMEHVEGAPIDRYCERHGLSIRDRLELFCKAAEAVQYAHGRLVVHRDLKPSNILVTADGQPKLLDFGIAKVLEPEGRAETTAGAARVMTPRYASPEQFRGQRISTASDVYSLGVVLYELLTGRRPYTVTEPSSAAYERAICEQAPLKPSTAVAAPAAAQPSAEDGPAPGAARGDAKRLQRRLAGDLDTILLTALRKEPQRRYASVQHFADDVRRFLDHRPIAARPDSWGYRAGLFVRRNRAAVAAAAVALLALGAGVVVSAAMFLKADAARDAEAQARAAEADARAAAEEVNRFVNGMLAAVDPREQGVDITVREVLDQAARRVEEDLSGRPTVERGVRGTIGVAYRALGLYDQALPHLRRALELARQLDGEDHPRTADAMNELGVLLCDGGAFAEAEALHRAALAIHLRCFGEPHEALAVSMNNLAETLAGQGQHEDADALARQALEQRRALFGPRDLRVAESLNNLALLRYSQGAYAGAEALLRESLTLHRESQGADHPDVAALTNNLAGLLMARGAYPEAEEMFRAALAQRRQRLGPEHPHVATTLNNLAEVLRLQGRFAEAESLFRECLALRRTLLGEEHPATLKTMNNLALTLGAQEDFAAAEALHRETLALRRQVLGDRHPETTTSLNGLAHTLQKRGELSAAEPLFREALAIRAAALGPQHPHVALTMGNLARVLLDLGAPGEAQALCEQAIQTQRAALGNEHPYLAATLKTLGRALSARGEHAQARDALVEAQTILTAKVGADDPRTRSVLQHLAEAYEAWDAAGPGQGHAEQAAELRARQSAHAP